METLTRRAARETAVVLAFLALTAAMTWPWAAHFRDTVSDPGDPYLNSWILWWDFHQTFHGPLHLFDGNIFHPLKTTLAFSEHNYGIALLLFPLFAFGIAPLTAHGVAVFLAFALSGYGTFRLARTLTGSTTAAWIAGIGFAFAPFRFMHIAHVNYLFAAWIPLLIEAVVLLARRPVRARAAWLGTAFLLNGLTCIHWFVLTLVPLAATAAFLATRLHAASRRDFLRRAAAALAVAGLLLLPFLIPYQIVKERYGMVRSAEEAGWYSASVSDWMLPDGKVHRWYLGDPPRQYERCLYPGLLLLLLPAIAFFLEPLAARRDAAPAGTPPGPLLRALDAFAAVAAVVALLSRGSAPLTIAPFGHLLFRSSSPSRALAVLAAALLLRWCLAWPAAFGWCREPNLLASLRALRRSEAFLLGTLLALFGFFGSLGMNFPFHRMLFDTIPIFRAIRGPARWAMVADVGLAVLAGLGAVRLIDAARRRWPARRALPAVLGIALAGAMLLDQRVAPMEVFRGAPDPDPLTRRLSVTPMSEGIVELPTDVMSLCLYTLRAADHGRPLVTSYSGFEPPHAARIRELSDARPVAPELLDRLEENASYLVVHGSRMSPADRAAMRDFASRGIAAGRLRFVARFEPREDLFAVVKNEPGARAEMPLPWVTAPPGAREDESLLGSVDEPAEEGVVRGELVVRGWARTTAGDLDVAFAIDDELRAPRLVKRWERPDVCQVFPKLAPCGAAGYEARFPREAWEEDGPHTLVAIFHAKDGRVRHYPIRRFAWKR